MKAPIAEAPPESDRLPGFLHPREQLRLFGHHESEQTFLRAVQSKRLHHAWIIGGPEGIGKATLAWRMARFLSAYGDDEAHLNQANDLTVAANHPAQRRIAALSSGSVALLRREWNEKTKKFYTDIRVDDLRRAMAMFQLKSAEGGWRCVIIDSAEDLNASGANALLKLIEEPPPQSLFLIVAHRPGALPATIRSRCRRLLLSPLSSETMTEAVRTLMGDRTPGIERLQRAIEGAEGSLREALLCAQGTDSEFALTASKLFDQLPRIDWRTAYALADSAAGREQEVVFAALLKAAFDFLTRCTAEARALGPRALVPYAEAWSELEKEARALEIYNLDRRTFILKLVVRLSEARLQAHSVLLG